MVALFIAVWGAMMGIAIAFSMFSKGVARLDARSSN